MMTVFRKVRRRGAEKANIRYGQTDIKKRRLPKGEATNPDVGPPCWAPQTLLTAEKVDPAPRKGPNSWWGETRVREKI